MFSKLTATALFAISQVEQQLDQAIMFERPEIVTATPEPNTTYPGDECCMLYVEYDFGTNGYLNVCKPYNVNPFTYDIQHGDYSWMNDKMSSWYCGKKVAYDFCAITVGADCTGDNGNSGAGTARNFHYKKNDRTSVIILYDYNPEIQGAVTMFDDPGCSGKSGRFYAPLSGSYPNEYNQDEMWQHNMGTNRMNSMLVPPGVTITLWDEPNFSREIRTIDGSFYEDESMQKVRCVNYDDIADRVTSVSVKRTYGT